MKEFKVSEYLSNDKFKKMIARVVNAKSGEDLKESLILLDNFVSSESEIPNITIMFNNSDVNGLFVWNPFCIFLNDQYLQCEYNEEVLAVYFHEKRHHLQYVCYQKHDLLLGEDILSEIDQYINQEDVTAITKMSVFHGTYGYYGRLVERDAYNYEKDCVVDFCNVGVELWGENKNRLLMQYYKEHCTIYNDYEMFHWINTHKRNFAIRKIVEEQLLLDIKHMIDFDIGNAKLKRIIFSDRLFDCLDEAEKRKVSSYFKSELSDRKIKKSNEYLSRVISRRMTKQKHLENREIKKSRG